MTNTEDKQQLLTRIDKALDSVRPHLAVDGGDIEVVELTEDFILKVKWLGACQSCAMSTMTMRAGIEQAIRAQVREVKGVIAINGMGI